MVAALHAQRILEAWDVTAPDQRDNGQFKVELNSALSTCQTAVPASSLENEQQAVLESVARQLGSARSGNSLQVEAGLFLLRHLSTRIH